MGHDHTRERRRYALSAGIAFLAATTLYFLAKAVGSAAGMGDAIHLAADGFSSLVSWEIVRRIERDHTAEASVRRRGAYVQAGLLFLAAPTIFAEAWHHHEEPRSALEMMVLGGISTAIAWVRFSIVHPEWRRSITGKAEVFHVAIDLGTSVMVIIAGVGLWLFGEGAIDRIIAMGLIAPLALGGGIYFLSKAKRGHHH